ncbi:MAG: FAD-dependent oxidoreductase [Thermodesulfobacteriota bacterium]
MTKTITCPVRETSDRLADLIESGRLNHPWSRQRTLEIIKLINDVAQGRGGPDHLPAMKTLALRLADEGRDPEGRTVGTDLIRALAEHHEVFASHLGTHNCATGDCLRLAPAPCQTACPAGIDIPSYITLIGQGRDAEAIELIRKDNPFPWVCGLVCTNPCELMCVRGRVDEPVSIKYLKAFAAERAMSEGSYKNPVKAPDNGRRVCVLGAGPAGLTGAFYLALRGYRITVIEGLPQAGGMMLAGIPRYRLPQEVIAREVAMIQALGVEFRFNTYLGLDVTLDELRAEGFEAFLVALGAHSCWALQIPGEHKYRPVLSAVTLLGEMALGERHLPGRRVAVVGGGNVALDAARTCIRLGAEEVTVVYRRTRHEMSANPEEVEQAGEEGVRLAYLTLPVAVEGEAGRVTGLRCLGTELGPPDADSRRRPVPIEGSEMVLSVDAVIGAIGQVVHPGGLLHEKGLSWSRRGTLVVETSSMATTVRDIFAAGDGVTGPATLVEAIGGGKKAAEAIDRCLSGLPLHQMPPVPVRRARLPYLEVAASTKMILRRPPMPLLGHERRRVTFQQVELGLSENAARQEARRCLRCDICLRCGACVAVCRDKMGVDALRLGYLDPEHPGLTDFRITAERCIGCGACAANCPTGAMNLSDNGRERILSLCGTVLSRQILVTCASCGAALGTARYHDFITSRTMALAKVPEGQRLCADCARGAAARMHVDTQPAPSGGGGYQERTGR